MAAASWMGIDCLTRKEVDGREKAKGAMKAVRCPRRVVFFFCGGPPPELCVVGGLSFVEGHHRGLAGASRGPVLDKGWWMVGRLPPERAVKNRTSSRQLSAQGFASWLGWDPFDIDQLLMREVNNSSEA